MVSSFPDICARCSGGDFRY